MALSFSEMIEEARLSARALLDYGDHFFNPTVRLGVTGLSRAGKTVFITALIHGLTRGGRFPIFEPFATGRIAKARLAPQPDDAVPRFDYENHVRTLMEQRRWPNSTVDISELRLVIDYQRKNGADRTLTLDIVDYPGEWLLDLPLLNKSYEQWSAESLSLSRERPRARLATQWHSHLGPEALVDLEAALAGILDCFRIGRSTLLSSLFRPRIDRILFAATKADDLHHSSHDRLEAVLRRTVNRAVARAEDTGADIDVVALAAARATREAQVQRGREKLPSILGTPAPGETAGVEAFDGETEVATFPGDLPADPEELFMGEAAFRGLSSAPAEKSDFRFLRFRPPQLEREGIDEPVLPHIRLDRALQFLIGDRLQ